MCAAHAALVCMCTCKSSWMRHSETVINCFDGCTLLCAAHAIVPASVDLEMRRAETFINTDVGSSSCWVLCGLCAEMLHAWKGSPLLPALPSFCALILLLDWLEKR